MLPGGLIPSGIGGRLYVGNLGNVGDILNPSLGPTGTTNAVVQDVINWALERQDVVATCPHSGTYGAISRRYVAFDWRAQINIAYDYTTAPPEELLFVGAAQSNLGHTIGLRLNLADVTQDPLLLAYSASQRFYFCPSVVLERARPVLNAQGDIIRMACELSGNALMFLFPNDQTSWNTYQTYLNSRGWNT
jgi:hypothetical protein